ncbi:MAG: hypothetical protein L3J76_02280 [Candidatus Hydrothermae bacterium]|nr:hypothetical protein [Candidatus Hydrothermae bacterium]
MTRPERRINCAGETEWVFRFPSVQYLPEKAYRRDLDPGYVLYIPRAGVVFLRVPAAKKAVVEEAVRALAAMEDARDLGALFRWMDLPLLRLLPERRRNDT